MCGRVKAYAIERKSNMAIKLTLTDINRCKRGAKLFAKENGVSYSAALDHVAKQKGFANWSLLAKHFAASHRPTGLTLPPAPAGQNRALAQRWYLHGDEQEDRPGMYYCVCCDLFMSADHFSHHPAHAEGPRGELYLAEIRNWRKSHGRLAHLSRPPRAANLLKKAAHTVRSAYESTRSPFHCWLEKQEGRDDEVGDLARDVRGSDQPPCDIRHRRALENYFKDRGAAGYVIRTIRAAWREFEAVSSPKEG